MSDSPIPAEPGGDDGLWVRALGWVWKNYEQIKTRLKEVRDWWSSRKPTPQTATETERGILVIGPGGAGKTTLACILSGDFDWLTDDPWDYGESTGVERYQLEDDPKVKVVVPPGQQARRKPTWVDHELALAAGKYRGVVLVFSAGFESPFQGGYRDHPLFEGEKATFFDRLVQANRDDEIVILRRLTPFLRTVPGKLWLLTLVTKQDLWYPQRKGVEQRYTGGEFTELVESVRAVKGDVTFRAEWLPLSLVIATLTTSEGEILRKNTEGYDHHRQVDGMRRLFEVLKSLMEWEGSK